MTQESQINRHALSWRVFGVFFFGGGDSLVLEECLHFISHNRNRALCIRLRVRQLNSLEALALSQACWCESFVLHRSRLRRKE